MVVGFPVIYSTLQPKALVSEVLSCYSIGDVKECQFWRRGLSDVYLVETLQKQYILRISHCHWRSKSEIDFELALLDFLHQQCLPVAYPLRTRSGDLSIELNAPEGKRYASLFIYAPGCVPIGDLNPTQAAKLGETVAKIHQAGVKFSCDAARKPLTLDYLLDDSWKSIAPFLKHRPQDFEYLEGAIADVKRQLEDFPQQPPYWAICWGDPHSGNAHFTPDDQVTLFDFDQCGYGWRAFDIGKFRQVALNTGISRRVREAFLNGYQSVSAIAEFEVFAIPAFTQTAHVWMWSISLTNALRHNYSRLDDSYFHIRLEQLKKLKSPDWQLF
jgi:Ser/Thr protein kinase RdoA (MazF antagonist)